MDRNNSQLNHIGKILKILKNKLKQRLNKHCNVKLFYDDNNNNPKTFEQQAIRLSFVQFFIDIFRNYRKYLQYKEVNTLNMTFNQTKFLNCSPENVQLFVSDFIKTHSFQRFINLRISQDIQEQNADLITFDYCIAKTMQSISSVTNINELNLKSLIDKLPDSTLSSNGYATSSSWLQ